MAEGVGRGSYRLLWYYSWTGVLPTCPQLAFCLKSRHRQEQGRRAGESLC